MRVRVLQRLHSSESESISESSFFRERESLHSSESSFFREREYFDFVLRASQLWWRWRVNKRGSNSVCERTGLFFVEGASSLLEGGRESNYDDDNDCK